MRVGISLWLVTAKTKTTSECFYPRCPVSVRILFVTTGLGKSGSVWVLHHSVLVQALGSEIHRRASRQTKLGSGTPELNTVGDWERSQSASRVDAAPAFTWPSACS